MLVLRQSTAVVVAVGPFVDVADGFTGLTGLSSQNGRYVTGGAGAVLTPSSWAHDGGGVYLVGLSTTHTGTVGALRLTWYDAATYLPVWLDAMVVEEAVYDALFASGAAGYATASGISQILADTQDIAQRLPAALVSGRIDASVGAMAAGTVTAAAVATGAIDADALAADAVTEIAAGISIPSAASIADAVWDEGTSGHQTAGTTGKALSDAGAAGDPWEAAVRTLTQPAASVVAAVTGSNIAIYTHATASISLTGLGSIAARDDLWFVVTSSPEDDTAAEVLIEETAGLTVLAGASYATAAHGSITVDDADDGDITITLAATAAAGLTRGTHGYAVKMRAGSVVTMLSHGGRCSIVQGAPEAIA